MRSMMRGRRRVHGRVVAAVDTLCVEDAPWHESRDDRERGLRWGREKARLLKWVRNQMGRRLTPTERRCVELHYFEGLTFREAARHTGTQPSSVCRAVQRSIRKLRQAAAEQGVVCRWGRR